MNDEQQENWVERLTGANREPAISELRELLVRGLSKSLGNRYDTKIQVEDVVQDALIKILASLDQFEGRSRFTTWAMTIATRVGISELRRKHYKDVSLSSMTTGDDLKIDITTATESSPESGLDRRNLLRRLQELIESELTEKQRAATQGLLDGLPVEEIARRAGSNRNAIYKLVHDARVRLRDGFANSGIKADDVNLILTGE